MIAVAAAQGMIEPGVSPSMREALALLRQARDFAGELGRDVWEFAVELAELKSLGMSSNELRWLVCKGLIEQADEMTPLGEGRRVFRRTGTLGFEAKTCFILSDAGAAIPPGGGPAKEGPGPSRVLLGGLLDPDRDGRPAIPAIAPGDGRPKWDRQRMELRLGGLVVKQFKVPAKNQEIVLSAFDEEGWPHRIDDPIPPQADACPKRRLHDTINSLNRSQKNPLIRFLGDGSGQGVRWDLARHLPATNGHARPRMG